MFEPHALSIHSSAVGGDAPIVWLALGDRAAAAIDIDFESGDRPGLVTAVLASCRQIAPGEPPGQAALQAWQLSLAGRIGGLAAIYARTWRTDVLPLVLTCAAAGCGEALEAPLPIADLMEMAREAERSPTLPFDSPGGRVVLRRPRGEDQRLWRAAPADVETLRARILATLIVAGEADPTDLIGRASEELEAFDPLPAFRIAATCPACGAENDHPVDLEALLLGELAHAQSRLIAEIHTLAAHYGWSEDDILAVPPRRRARYLGLVRAGAGEGW